MLDPVQSRLHVVEPLVHLAAQAGDLGFELGAQAREPLLNALEPLIDGINRTCTQLRRVGPCPNCTQRKKKCQGWLPTTYCPLASAYCLMRDESDAPGEKSKSQRWNVEGLNP
jgi:hypothetical protein